MTDILFQLVHDFNRQKYKAAKHSVSSSTEMHGAGFVDKVYWHYCTAHHPWNLDNFLKITSL